MKYKFTQDWHTRHIPVWEWALKDLKGKPIQAIELGSYEGQASVWLLDNILTHDKANLICVDTWEGSEEHSDTDMKAVRDNFNHNLACKRRGIGKVRIFKGTSTDFLLTNQETEADLIYIDASHRAADVLSDAVLSDLLLKPGGILIFDDYIWGAGLEHRVDTPRAAIDAFMECYADRYDMVVTGVQVILKKKNNG